jgi:hypothetical protein
MELTRLTGEQCRAAMAAGEFGEDVRAAAERVAVVLTQGWCPQWGWMARYLAKADYPEDSAVFLCVYDEEPFYEEFMAFKEGTFGNYEIPYVRYYRDGEFRAASNFIAEDGFRRRLLGD